VYTFDLQNSCGQAIQWRMASDLHPDNTYGPIFLAELQHGQVSKVAQGYPIEEFVLMVRIAGTDGAGTAIRLDGGPVILAGDMCPTVGGK